MSDLVGNPEDRFSHNEAQIICCGYLVELRCQGDFVFNAILIDTHNIHFIDKFWEISSKIYFLSF